MAEPSEWTASLLLGSPLLRKLARAETAAILRDAHLRKLKKDEVLFHQGDVSQATFIIGSGRIKLSQLSHSGNQTLLRILGPGEILAISTTVGSARYPATAVAERAGELLYWDGGAFEELIRRFPQLGINALRIVSERIREMQERFGELAAEKVERRLSRTLMRLAAQHGKSHEQGVLLDLEISRQDLAEMSGSTLFSISRILSAWEKAGIVKAGRKKIVIRKPHALFVIAEELE